MLNKKAFTLTELLIALAIIGAIAALTVPSLFSNVNNKLLTTQLKNMAGTIQQLANDQMVMHRTKYLENTDFSEPTTLLTDKNFSIVKTCDDDYAESDCWGLGWDTDSQKVVNVYKAIDKLKTDSNDSSKKIRNKLEAFNILEVMGSPTIKLKNGAMLTYHTVENEVTSADNTKVVGYFFFDVNGNDKPNTVGRDLFGFYITNKGTLVGPSDLASTRTPKEGEENAEYDPNEAGSNFKIDKCKTGAEGSEGWCYEAVVDNGWEMPY
ncbi:prepilin-type N-terminal cleavage/methylation domain-containing protein [bacterium]|nr:prepilin-type N-terminal cleavage/methylation domain-containing protein [bacterium]